MNWEIAAALAELISALAVIVTLLYLAIQIRDGAKAAKLTAIQSQRELRIEMFYSNRDSPCYPALQLKLDSGEDFTPEEGVRVSQHMSAQWGFVYADQVQREIGLMGEFATTDTYFTFMINDSTAMDWWDRAGTQIYPDKFVDYVSKGREGDA